MGAVLMMRVTAAWAASVALTSAHLGTGIVTPYLFPTSVSTTNNGNKAGKLQASDSVTLNFSEQIQASTLCSSASNSVTSQNLPGLTAQLVDNGATTGNDQLAFQVGSSTCSALHIGTLDLGSANYVTGGSVSFPTSSALVTQGTSTATVTITLGTPSAGGTLGTLTGGSSVLYTPDPTITDKSSHAIGTSTAATSVTSQF